MAGGYGTKVGVVGVDVVVGDSDARVGVGVGVGSATEVAGLLVLDIAGLVFTWICIDN